MPTNTADIKFLQSIRERMRPSEGQVVRYVYMPGVTATVILSKPEDSRLRMLSDKYGMSISQLLRDGPPLSKKTLMVIIEDKIIKQCSTAKGLRSFRKQLLGMPAAPSSPPAPRSRRRSKR